MTKEPEIKGRLDRIGKTTLEHFQVIKELLTADGPEVTVEDIVPYQCEQVEKSLNALEIIKEKDVDIYILRKCKTVDEYNFKIVHIVGETRELTEEEFELLKEVLK